MKFTSIFQIVACLTLGVLHADASQEKPNIVYILADDLGYGDVTCLNPGGKIPTPHLDRLATQGMIFSDAHSSSSVCTPSRYNLLTGRHAWRTRLQKGVLGGWGRPLISATRLTVPRLLKENGYTTVCIGKWHLGMSMPNRSELHKVINDGPTTRGFDEFFGISASLDMPPYGFITGDRFTPPLDTEKELFKGRRGAAASSFHAENVLPILVQKATEQISEKAALRKPFFLYLALTSPHTPIAPSESWRGKSSLGAYGDFVMETDGAVGEVLRALDEASISDQTLVIFSSDNGFAPAAGPKRLEKLGHFPSASFRGYKADIWDGGHRVPFIARWPGVVEAGTTRNDLIYLGDLIATCADILDVKLPENAGEDSLSMLPALRGETDEHHPRTLIHHSINGCFGIREGDWKLELCPGSGGWGTPVDSVARRRGLPDFQLYDLSKDRGETRNLQAEYPEIVTRLRKKLEDQISKGRSTPGKELSNDTKVLVVKPPAVPE